MKAKTNFTPEPKYNTGQSVWYFSNFVRKEGHITDIKIQNGHIFYQVGDDLVPQEQVLLIEKPYERFF